MRRINVIAIYEQSQSKALHHLYNHHVKREKGSVAALSARTRAKRSGALEWDTRCKSDVIVLLQVAISLILEKLQ
jgi:hypothetical protein